MHSLALPSLNAQLPRGWKVIRDDNDTRPRVFLRKAFDKYRLPILVQEGRKQSTIREYRTAIRAWESYWLSGINRGEPDEKPSVSRTEGHLSSFDPGETQEPSIDQISRDHLAEFRGWYSAGSRGKLQVNKCLKNIQAILTAAEDSDEIEAAPKLRMLTAAKNTGKTYLSYDHVDAIYRACSVAEWPTKDHNRQELKFSPEQYWRAAVVLFFNYGFRTQELIAYENDHESLKWGQVSFEEESPASEVTNSHGWFWYTPQKQEDIKPEPLVLPMPFLVKAHIKSIWHYQAEDSSLVFPFPRNKKRFYATWTAIAKAAGVKPKAALTSKNRRTYQIKDFRKTCATWHNVNFRGIAPFVLGHASRDSGSVAMTDGHYDNPEMALIKAFSTLAQPSSFALVQNENQLKMF